MRFTQGVGDNEQENAGSLLTCRLMTITAKGLEEYENVSGVFFRFLSPHPFTTFVFTVYRSRCVSPKVLEIMSKRMREACLPADSWPLPPKDSKSKKTHQECFSGFCLLIRSIRVLRWRSFIHRTHCFSASRAVYLSWHTSQSILTYFAIYL